MKHNQVREFSTSNNVLKTDTANKFNELEKSLYWVNNAKQQRVNII